MIVQTVGKLPSTIDHEDASEAWDRVKATFKPLRRRDRRTREALEAMAEGLREYLEEAKTK